MRRGLATDGVRIEQEHFHPLDLGNHLVDVRLDRFEGVHGERQW